MSGSPILLLTFYIFLDIHIKNYGQLRQTHDHRYSILTGRLRHAVERSMLLHHQFGTIICPIGITLAFLISMPRHHISNHLHRWSSLWFCAGMLSSMNATNIRQIILVSVLFIFESRGAVIPHASLPYNKQLPIHIM